MDGGCDPLRGRGVARPIEKYLIGAFQVGRLVRERAGAELRRLTGKARSGGRSELLADGLGFDSLHVAGSRLGLVHAL